MVRELTDSSDIDSELVTCDRIATTEWR
jgi:hypothetical protein